MVYPSSQGAQAMFPDLFSSLGSFFVTSFISLFVIISPPGAVFPYLTLTAGYSAAARQDLARRTCFYSFLILAIFIFLGRYIIGFLGISLPSFQIAGGLILFRIAFDMLEGRGAFNRLDTSSSPNVADYGDIAMTPMAMPLLSGPGAITTTLVLSSRSQTHLEDFLILAAVITIMISTYILFRCAERLLSVMKENGMRLVTRLMGLTLAALAVEFVVQGIRTAFLSAR